MQVLAAAARAARKAWRFLIGENDVSRDALAHVLKDNFDGHLIIGEEGRIIAASHVATTMLLGQGSGTLVGRLTADVLPKPILDVVQQALVDGRRAVSSPVSPAVIGDPDSGGYVVQFVVTLSEIGSHGGLPQRVVSLTFWDETDRRRREQELAFIGTHDQLTGAITRGELLKSIGAALESERGRAGGLIVIVLDLRRFNALNGVLGHAYGDQLLKLVVSRLKAAGVEAVARLGGDSFGMIVRGRWSPDETRHFCIALIERISAPYALGGHRALVGASVGVTHTGVSGYDADIILSHAELALAAAKGAHGNSFVSFTADMDRRLGERQAMDLALRLAHARKQLSIAYDPQCALDTGDLVGVEAVVRWNHPDLGLIPADRFIPAAEENGEILEIGRWVLQTACRDAAGWPFETRLAVGVSPTQFEFIDVVAEVREALAESGLPAHRLDIEIADGLLVSGPGPIADTLQDLRRLGVGIVLAGFGAGYCSLGHLGRLPIDKIKIDRRFVASLPADTEAGAIIRAVMTLSETLGKVVIAEGVETRDQAWLLRMIGCRLGQGRHFGSPLSGDKMALWHADRAGDEKARGS